MKQHYTVKQLAEHYQVAPMTIYRWKKDGLPHKTVGARSVRFDLDEVENWMKQKQAQ